MPRRATVHVYIQERKKHLPENTSCSCVQHRRFWWSSQPFPRPSKRQVRVVSAAGLSWAKKRVRKRLGQFFFFPVVCDFGCAGTSVPLHVVLLLVRLQRRLTFWKVVVGGVIGGAFQESFGLDGSGVFR